MRQCVLLSVMMWLNSIVFTVVFFLALPEVVQGTDPLDSDACDRYLGDRALEISRRINTAEYRNLVSRGFRMNGRWAAERDGLRVVKTAPDHFVLSVTDRTILSSAGPAGSMSESGQLSEILWTADSWAQQYGFRK